MMAVPNQLHKEIQEVETARYKTSAQNCLASVLSLAWQYRGYAGGALPKSCEHLIIQIYLGFYRVISRNGIKLCTAISRSDPLTLSTYTYVK